MMKTTLITAAVITSFAGASFAQDTLACDEETIAAVAAAVEASPEATKEAAMSELTMAKEKMAENDAETCALHLTNASSLSTQQ
ncbi:hypothetical protein GCM10008927_09020 [Amylibacter ulvae]|uniref:Uncharacterized protein n=1 Tax=Paramylibacter ulvae TaxID=1651968 RepID=A0ABQ3CY40_9RHOB|nr:hypothetical protein [Amylibacter ulvae]GHA46047.1 hypothetical protein GCM10008927_09020 [Amylibacter ulvae]